MSHRVLDNSSIVTVHCVHERFTETAAVMLADIVARVADDAGHRRRRPQRPRHRRSHRADDPSGELPTAPACRQCASWRAAGRVADHGERCLAEPGRRRCDRGAGAQRHVRPPADRTRSSSPLPADHRRARALPARPVHGDARPGVAARSRPDRRACQQADPDVELPRPPGAARAGGASCARRGRSSRRRSPSSTGRWTRSTASPRSSCASVTASSSSTHVPADARPARTARLRGHRRRRRRRGPTVAGVRAALAARECAVLLQPRAQNPTGVALTPRRAQRLADCSPERTRSSSRTTTPTTSRRRRSSASARGCPARTVHVRSYSKSHGPDLRLAAVGGAGDIVTAVANRRLLGPGWSSRILQAVLLELLRDPATPAVMADAAGGVRPPAGAGLRRAHGRRRRGHRRATGSTCGWRSPTSDPRWSPGGAGIGAAPGEPFLVRPDDDHLRVTVGLIAGPDDHVRAVAASPRPRRRRLPTRQASHR